MAAGLTVGECFIHTIKGIRNEDFFFSRLCNYDNGFLKRLRKILAEKRSTDCGVLHLGRSYHTRPASELQTDSSQSKCHSAGRCQAITWGADCGFAQSQSASFNSPCWNLHLLNPPRLFFFPGLIDSQPFGLLLLILMTLKCTIPWCLFTIKAVVCIVPTCNLN